MLSFDRPNLFTYALTGSIALVASLALSGCRFGNSEQDAGASDPVSGYYETQAEALNFCVGATAGGESCADSNPVNEPSDFTSVFSNPVGVYMVDQTSGATYFFNPSTKVSLGAIPIDPTVKDFDAAFPIGGGTLWSDKQCKLDQALSMDGNLTGSGPYNSGTTLPLKGRVVFGMTVTSVLTGDCVASLQAAANCYQNGTSCNGSGVLTNQASVIALFGPFFKAGLVTTSTLPNYSRFSYTVQYQ